MTHPSFVYADQLALIGKKEVVGFGNADLTIREIDRLVANRYIITNHYSGKVYNATYIHLGVFDYNGTMQGVLQYGAAMNPASCSTVVTGTEQDQYLELNRMHLSDAMPRNSESRAIAYSIRYIRANYPRVKWIQSFADERCGLLGVVYQACSFDYYGEHTSTFWELDDVWYHNIQMTVKDAKRLRGGAMHLQQNAHRATPHELRQFRYIKWIDPRWKTRCTLTPQPYPKMKTKEPS